MAELKTKKTKVSIEDYLNQIDDPSRKKDAERVHSIMKEITGDKGSMWGSTIAGYGLYHYVYASGKEADWMATGWSSRKNALTLYIMSGFDKYDELMSKLGKFKTGKACLYVKKMEDIDESVLRELISLSVDYITKKYPTK